ncbi:alpha-hydroxy acid oxidase [Microbacterium sp. X-17]|uniref:alpha-hydroxy acid oxidase n=1 Tax=Microbacterium sp. X-17 TaxID=3144404 RepID=UPI0031F4B0E3
MRDVSKILSYEDAEYYGRKRMPKGTQQMVEGGTGLGKTVQENQDAFQTLKFRPRTGVAVPNPDLSTTVVGFPVSMPVLTAPTGNVRTVHRDGEPAVARATGDAGTIAVVSTMMGYPIEEVIAASKGTVFFQLYFVGGRSNVEVMIDRAKRAGAGALVVTIDLAAYAQRERNARMRVDGPLTVNLRNALTYGPQFAFKPAWLLDFLRDGMQVNTPMWVQNNQPTEMWTASKTMLEDSPTFEDLEWIRELWGGPLIVKGIMNPDDARRAVDAGANGIIVSNHGGNTIDGARPTIFALPEIVDAVGSDLEVLLDSGVRRGNDVARALALGARAVLIGRPYVWALGAAGGAGVSRILEVFRDQLSTTLRLLGCQSVADLDPSYLVMGDRP